MTIAAAAAAAGRVHPPPHKPRRRQSLASAASASSSSAKRLCFRKPDVAPSNVLTTSRRGRSTAVLPTPPPVPPAPRKHTTKSPIVKKPAGPARKISALPRVKPGPELLHKVLVTSNGVPVVVTDVSSVDATSCLGRALHFSPEYGFERAARATSYDLRQMAKAGAGLLDDAQFAHEHDRNHVLPSKVRLLLGDCEYIDEAHEFAIDLARAAAA